LRAAVAALMRSKRSPLLFLVAALSLSSCSPDPIPDAEPPSEAPSIYRYTPTWCHGACWSLTLSRSETFLELRAHQPDGTFVGLATGILSEPASDELDQLIDEAVLGELPGFETFDAPLIDLWLPGMHFMYDHFYPPSGLVEIDAFLAKVLDDMSQCRATTQITPDHDCEPLAWFPE
jgi:hypothetical protein